MQKRCDKTISALEADGKAILGAEFALWNTEHVCPFQTFGQLLSGGVLSLLEGLEERLSGLARGLTEMGGLC